MDRIKSGRSSWPVFSKMRLVVLLFLTHVAFVVGLPSVIVEPVIDSIISTKIASMDEECEKHFPKCRAGENPVKQWMVWIKNNLPCFLFFMGKHFRVIPASYFPNTAQNSAFLFSKNRKPKVINNKKFGKFFLD